MKYLHIKSIRAACRDKDVVVHMWGIEEFISIQLKGIRMVFESGNIERNYDL